MKKLIPLALLSTSIMGQECPSFSIQQLHTLQTVHDYGETRGLAKTLPAISWVESRAGEVLVGINKNGANDYGAFQINLKTASNMEGTTSAYQRNILASKLITNVKYSSEMAVEVLSYWYNYHKDWNKMVMSYNAGFNVEAGQEYKDKVVKAIRMLERCVKL